MDERAELTPFSATPARAAPVGEATASDRGSRAAVKELRHAWPRFTRQDRRGAPLEPRACGREDRGNRRPQGETRARAREEKEEAGKRAGKKGEPTGVSSASSLFVTGSLVTAVASAGISTGTASAAVVAMVMTRSVSVGGGMKTCAAAGRRKDAPPRQRLFPQESEKKKTPSASWAE